MNKSFASSYPALISSTVLQNAVPDRDASSDWFTNRQSAQTAYRDSGRSAFSACPGGAPADSAGFRWCPLWLRHLVPPCSPRVAWSSVARNESPLRISPYPGRGQPSRHHGSLEAAEVEAAIRPVAGDVEMLEPGLVRSECDARSSRAGSACTARTDRRWRQRAAHRGAGSPPRPRDRTGNPT